MDFGQLYHFLFETFEGIGCLIAIGLVISIIACIIMERRTRKRFVSREPTRTTGRSSTTMTTRRRASSGSSRRIGLSRGPHAPTAPVFNLATIRTAHPPHRTIAR